VDPYTEYTEYEKLIVKAVLARAKRRRGTFRLTDLITRILYLYGGILWRGID